MKTTFYLDEVSSKAVKELPRKISASKLLRWLLKLVNTTNKEWNYLIKHDDEVKEVQDWIRPKLRKALGLPDVEDKSAK